MSSLLCFLQSVVLLSLPSFFLPLSCICCSLRLSFLMYLSCSFLASFLSLFHLAFFLYFVLPDFLLILLLFILFLSLSRSLFSLVSVCVIIIFFVRSCCLSLFVNSLTSFIISVHLSLSFLLLSLSLVRSFSGSCLFFFGSFVLSFFFLSLFLSFVFIVSFCLSFSPNPAHQNQTNTENNTKNIRKNANSPG